MLRSIVCGAILIVVSGAALAEGIRPCRSLVAAERTYTVCEAPLATHAIKLYWRKPDGQPYNFLSALPKTTPSGDKLAFAINGGMFHPDYSPVGLYIEGGQEFKKANTASGAGNFHIKPNGIFYAGSTEAGVLDTGTYLKRKPQADIATQSGPMLVVSGRVNSRIANASASEKQRSGVCVRDGKVAVFAISESGVSFAAFARLFRDTLKCRDALFLDGGSAPALYAPNQNKPGNALIALGPMIAVYAKAEKAQ
jgi:uncharacterized protein YigE (DUF2233 family)